MRSPLKRLAGILAVVGVVAFGGAPAYASTIVWGNNASFGGVMLEAFDGSTGALITQFLLPNAAAAGDNGRGVALLGHTIYYTTANSGVIYKTNDLTHTDDGILVNTGFPGIANVATDGIFIYASSYQTASGVVNKYDTSGNLVGTVNVGTGFGRDGFEVQNNPNFAGGATTFISNRGDLVSPYDVYASDGTLLSSAFINPSANGFGTGQTGIAYDGTDYWVSQINGNQLLKYSGTGAFLGAITLQGTCTTCSSGRLLEDLSTVGNTVTNPNTGVVPEPATLVLFGTGLSLLVARARRKRAL